MRTAVTKKEELLQALRQKVKKCKGCSLHKGREGVVFGCGLPSSCIMFIGEAPGEKEVEEEEPFVGPAGKVLNKGFGMVESIGRENIYIENILKCRPPSNREPLRKEMDACRKILDLQIRIIDPKIVVTLGTVATKEILGKEIQITKEPIGKYDAILAGRNRYVIPLIHPAYYLHRRIPEPKKLIMGLKFVVQTLREIEKGEVSDDINDFVSKWGGKDAQGSKN